LVFLLAAIPLFSQEASSPIGDLSPIGDTEESAEVFSPPVEDASPITDDALQPFSPDDSMLYVIVDYQYSVKGITRPFALLYKLVENGEFRKGKIITGTANLEKYISDIAQIYINQLVLKDNAEVSYSTGSRNEDGTYPVTILIKVEDAWNLIALPLPYYKNGVFNLTIKARDYNFLGTMNSLRIDLGYGYNGNEEQPHSFLSGVFFDIPFNFLGYYWNFTFDNTVQYRFKAPVYYENTTGISMDLPFRSTTFTFGFNEKLYVNRENSGWAKAAGYEAYQGLYMSSNPYVSWRIPTGFTVSQFGDLAYTPSMSATINHEFPLWPLPDDRKGPVMNFSHSLGFGKIDWHANYREGLSFSMGNSYQYDFYRKIYDISFDFTGIGHHIVKDFFAVSARLMYRYWYSSDVTSKGSYISYNLRGISDTSILAYQALTLNLDFPVRLFAFTPSKWFNNNKLRLFDLEVHAAPVIDLALYREKDFDGEKTLYHHAGYAATGGLELMIFSSFIRSLYVRLGFAIDIKEFLTARPIRIPGGEHREIYFIMGHFY